MSKQHHRKTACYLIIPLMQQNLPVMVADGITAILASIIIVLKIWNERPVRNINPVRVRKVKNVVIKINNVHTLKKKQITITGHAG